MARGMQAGRQTTVRGQVSIAGIGVHSGSPVTLTLHPADADTGVVFWRRGDDRQKHRKLAANFRSVTATEFATVLGDKSGPAVSTTEHVMAALAGLGIDNVMFETDFPHPVCLFPIDDVDNAMKGLTEAEKVKVLSGNAAKLYNINL